MHKIIKITDDFIVVADSGRNVMKVPVTAFDFIPELNKKVEVYQLEDEYIVNEVKETKPRVNEQKNRTQSVDAESLKEKIHINIINENSPRNYNTNYTSNTQNYGHNDDYYGGHGVNKWLFIFVSFFLGGLGGNFFMIGRPFIGVLCILFSWTWIPSSIGLVHAIVAFFKRSDRNGYIYF